MTVADALLLALGAVAVGSGALVVTSAHLVRAGLFLVISLGAIAGLYLVLGAELVAWVQVLVYVGAVVVLLLFAVMLTRAPIGPSADLDRPAGPAALIGAGVGFGLAALLADAFRWTRYDLPPVGTAQRVGEQVFGAWVLPFEVLSILLLAALVGAIVLSRPDLGARPGPEAAVAVADAPTPDPSAESAEVVARLERIAARQAAAQARLRQAAAAGRPDPAADAPATAAPTAVDVDEAQKSKAHEVVFGAHERRARVGDPAGSRSVIEGAAGADRPVIEGPATERVEGPAAGKPALGRRAGRPGVGGRPNRPALEASAQKPAETPAAKPADKPAAEQADKSGDDTGGGKAGA